MFVDFPGVVCYPSQNNKYIVIAKSAVTQSAPSTVRVNTYMRAGKHERDFYAHSTHSLKHVAIARDVFDHAAVNLISVR